MCFQSHNTHTPPDKSRRRVVGGVFGFLNLFIRCRRCSVHLGNLHLISIHVLQQHFGVWQEWLVYLNLLVNSIGNAIRFLRPPTRFGRQFLPSKTSAAAKINRNQLHNSVSVSSRHSSTKDNSIPCSVLITGTTPTQLNFNGFKAEPRW